MKFARYLEETQIPEWKKAYIDYRGLKKRITAIRIAQEHAHDGSTPLLPPVSPALDLRDVQSQTRTAEDYGSGGPTLSPKDLNTDLPDAEELHEADHETSAERLAQPCHEVNASSAFSGRQETSDEIPVMRSPSVPRSSIAISTHSSRGDMAQPEFVLESTRRPGPFHAATVNMGFLPRLRKRSTVGRNYWEPSRRSKATLQWDLAKSIPLKDLYPLLIPVQRAFFEKLDIELDKVESFYVEREKEMRAKTSALKAQMQELKQHRQVFYDAQSTGHSWLPIMRRKGNALPASNTTHDLRANTARKRRSYKADVSSPKRPRSLAQENIVADESVGRTGAVPIQQQMSEDTLGNDHPHGSGSGSGGSGEDQSATGWKRLRHGFQKHDAVKKSVPPGSPPKETNVATMKFDPDEYVHAKKKLKKAALECYRGLEVLENYRTLNLIGFRKALKKFEKYTKIPAQQAFFVEKIEPCAFSSAAVVQGLLSNMEELYAARFTRGDNKLAKMRLRGEAQHKTHHYSAFRTGLLLGLALPAFVDALYLSFQPHTRQALPGYDGLLYIYAILLIPVLFSLLVGINVLIWSKSRINYVFIFELDLKTKLDHREYFEVPALLLSTLCYAFWLSFARVGTRHFSPTLWPLIWLIFAGVVILNPFPVLFKPSRWWLIRNISRLLTSGMHRVEFADFWMGDQFCSLVFSLSNLFFIACAYNGGLDDTWIRCLSPKPWGVPFILASLPLLVRLVQSVKRWLDSKLITHLINGGKYGAGIIYYLVYFNWRHHGGGRGGPFALWCIFGTIYALYASAWDLLMDWSVLRPHARYTLLRSDLLYTSYIPLYYFAIISNVMIRFIWVFYIPEKGPNFALRTFIAGMLEMFRRVQWNFYRLENEHLGNMDQYRATREVPLPYSFDDQGHESDGDEDDHKSVSSWRSKRKGGKKPQGDAGNN